MVGIIMKRIEILNRSKRIDKYKPRLHSQITRSNKRDNCQIFQIHDEHTHIRRSIYIDEVQESLDATRGLPQIDRKEYMYSVGIDFDKVKMYYDQVLEFERLYKSNTCMDDFLYMISKTFKKN